jgi:hypothetical protein
VNLKHSLFTIKNRPVINRRPVFLSLLVSIIVVSIILPAAGIVQAKTAFMDTTATPTPESQIEIPASGEPVIIYPGNNASVISPLKMQLATKPGEDGLVRLELIGKDNRLIFRRLIDYRAYKDQTLLINQTIPFEIHDDESARLQVVLEDAKGRTIFVNSISINLLGVRGRESAGDAPVNPQFRIDQLDITSEIKRKSLTVLCRIKPVNNTPVNIELVAKDGHTMSSRLVPIMMPNDLTAFASIKAELPFSVPVPTVVTLRIRQESNNLIKGTVLLWSSKITISPP